MQQFSFSVKPAALEQSEPVGYRIRVLMRTRVIFFSVFSCEHKADRTQRL